MKKATITISWDLLEEAKRYLDDSKNKIENIFFKAFSTKNDEDGQIWVYENNGLSSIKYLYKSIASLPNQVWKIVGTGKYTERYEIKKTDKISIITNQDNKIEFKILGTIQPEDNIFINVKKYEINNSGGKRQEIDIGQKKIKIVCFKIGIKDLEPGINGRIEWITNTGRVSRTAKVGFDIPKYLFDNSILQVRISSGMKVYKCISTEPLLPIQNNYYTDFDLNNVNEKNEFIQQFATNDLVLESEYGSQTFEIILLPKKYNTEIYKETVHLYRKALGITWKIDPTDWNSVNPKFIVNNSFNEDREPWAETKELENNRKFDWTIYKDIKDNRWHGNLTYSEITMQFSIADTKPKSPELLNWVELTEDLIFRTDDCDILSQMFTDLIKQSFHWYGHPLNGYGEQSPIPYYSTKAIIEHEKVHGRRYLDGCSEGSKKILLGFNDIFKKYEGLISKITVDGSKSYIEAYKIFEQEINAQIRPVIFGTGEINEEGEKIDGDINILIYIENHHAYNSKDFACAEILSIGNLLKKIKDRAIAIGCTLPQNGRIPEYKCP